MQKIYAVRTLPLSGSTRLDWINRVSNTRGGEWSTEDKGRRRSGNGGPNHAADPDWGVVATIKATIAGIEEDSKLGLLRLRPPPPSPTPQIGVSGNPCDGHRPQFGGGGPNRGHHLRSPSSLASSQPSSYPPPFSFS
ncbi:hypothetical protein CRG98_043794 [Punica granatum]|uniref:Uncharacterized protein n=1 Tax=Punica granatum TaxID=22663 RepID=A0A2I0HW29_PUNGR|nr:hypothetical protein CRG98_043794 [Punica granatum]